jgi:hypothetical protein
MVETAPGAFAVIGIVSVAKGIDAPPWLANLAVDSRRFAGPVASALAEHAVE